MARWKGHADHRTIGVDNAKAIHSQPANWRPGTIEIASTGTPSTTATTRRGARSRTSSASGFSGSASGTEYPRSATAAENDAGPVTAGS